MADDLDERLSRRLHTDDDTDSSSQNAQKNTNSAQSQTETRTQPSGNAQNIKKEWNVRSFYLDDDLDNELTTAFKRLDLELSEADADIALKKTRHFYPLVVELGLESLERMDRTEVTERLDHND